MATYKITPETSLFSKADGVSLFNNGSTSADTLTIDDGAYIIATGAGSVGAELASPGAWTANINGSIYSEDGYGVWLRGGAANSTINVGATGSIGSRNHSAIVMADTGTIKNAGSIIADDAIVFSGGAKHAIVNTGTIAAIDNKAVSSIVDNTFIGATTITNSGTIDGHVSLANGNNIVTNTGIFTQTLLTGDGNDTVTNNGSIMGVHLGNGVNKYTATSALSFVSLFSAGAGNDTVSTAGVIENLSLGDGVNKLTISKTGSSDDISGLTGSDTVTNAGLISTVFLGDGANVFNNTGTVTGNVTTGSDADKFTNSGTVTGDVDLGQGANIFANSGTLTGNIALGTGADKFTNTKQIIGTVDLGGGNNVIINSGSVSGILEMDDGDDKVTNSGTLSYLDLEGGTNILNNSGTIGQVNGGAGVDTIVNTGKITGYTELGDGDDKYIGGNFVDAFNNGGGADWIELRGGNDVYYANPSTEDDGIGIDRIDGGTGIDTYWDTHAGNGIGPQGPALVINIDTIAHAELTIVAAAGTVAANSASGGVGQDIVLNFENVRGRQTGDIIFGSGVANVLLGEDGSDGLFGYGGNDTLDGGADVDVLVGGAGADKLTGGAGVDYFLYQVVSDSGPGKAARDTILDFEDGVDFIELEGIDADTKNGIGNPGDQFHYTGQNVDFIPNDPGGLRTLTTATGWTIEGDVTGDGKADFAIDVSDKFHSIVWSASDFEL